VESAVLLVLEEVGEAREEGDETRRDMYAVCVLSFSFVYNNDSALLTMGNGGTEGKYQGVEVGNEHVRGGGGG